MKRILYILAIALSILACTDEIDKSNRYTFTGEKIADFLLNRSEKYSHMITLLKRAELFSLLKPEEFEYFACIFIQTLLFICTFSNIVIFTVSEATPPIFNNL